MDGYTPTKLRHFRGLSSAQVATQLTLYIPRFPKQTLGGCRFAGWKAIFLPYPCFWPQVQLNIKEASSGQDIIEWMNSISFLNLNCQIILKRASLDKLNTTFRSEGNSQRVHFLKPKCFPVVWNGPRLRCPAHSTHGFGTKALSCIFLLDLEFGDVAILGHLLVRSWV